MGEHVGPSANEVIHHFGEDGERLLGIDDESLAANAPAGPVKRRVSRRMLYVVVVGLLVLFMAAGGACYFTQVALRGFVTPDDDGPPPPGATAGGAPSSTGSAAGHQETAPGHVDQSWAPTYVKAGDWEIALARQKVVTEDYTPAAGNAKDGSTFVMVALFVVNKGSGPADLTAGCFAARSGGQSYPCKGFETQTANPGNPVAFEGAFEVPRGTQGLSVAFTPPEGGAATTLPLPEVRY